MTTEEQRVSFLAMEPLHPITIQEAMSGKQKRVQRYTQMIHLIYM